MQRVDFTAPSNHGVPKITRQGDAKQKRDECVFEYGVQFPFVKYSQAIFEENCKFWCEYDDNDR